MRIASLGQVLFALTLIGVGLVGFAQHAFPPIWKPVQQHPAALDVMIYVTSALSAICGAGLLVRVTSAWAARLLLLFALLFFVFYKAIILVKQPRSPLSWEACGESFVMIAVAWVLYAWLAGGDQQRLRFIAGENGVRIARVVYGLFALIPFGVAHYAYLDMTAPLIPDWLPAHVFLAYATGAAYIAAGIAILTGILARLAAMLVALQIAGFTFIVWAPAIASGHADAGAASEATVSWALTAGAIVVAETYRNTPWFGRAKF